MAVPFTYDSYREMVSAFRAHQYEFATFPDAESLLRASTRFVLLRHDVDLELDAARKLAQIEAELCIQATYFFLLRTEHYKVFSSRGTSAIKSILAFGHQLGLHFDCAAYPAEFSAEQLGRACDREASMLQDWFATPVNIVSFHRPAQQVLVGDPRLSGQRPHTYMDLFRTQIHYCSDSRGEWRFGSPLEQPAFRDGRPLHLLVHPIWWNAKPQSPEATLRAFLQRAGENMRHSVADNCTVLRGVGAQ